MAEDKGKYIPPFLSTTGVIPRRKAKRIAFSPVVLVMCLLSLLVPVGCATMRETNSWGKDVNFFPGWQHVGRAATDALKSPGVWLPAFTALALQLDDMDGRLTHWGSKHRPVFGSRDSAENASDHLRDTAEVAYYLTSIVTPEAGGPNDWLKAKIKGLSTGAMAAAFTRGTTNKLKGIADRRRPDKSNRRSFPSSHSSTAAVYSMLAYENVDYLPVTDRTKTVLHLGLGGLEFAAAWARVEAKRHYASDALAGMAIGNFFAVFVNKAFFSPESKGNIMFSLDNSGRGIMVKVTWRF